MAIPPNQSFLTATDVGTLDGETPTILTQDAWDGTQTVSDLFFRYTPVAGDQELLVYIGGDVVHYEVDASFWYGPPESPTRFADFALNTPAQIDISEGIPPGVDIFFQAHKASVGDHDPSTLTVRLQRGASAALAIGDLFINDSSPGFPGVVIDRATGAPKRYISGYPAGESNLNLTDGTICAIDEFTAPTGPRLFNNGLQLLATPTMPDTHFTQAVGTNQIDGFWVAKVFGGNGWIVPLTPEGAVGDVIDIGGGNIRSLTANSTNARVYVTRNEDNTNQPVYVVDTATGVVSMFLAGVSDRLFGSNLMMMTDDTLLVPYEANGVDSVIKRYNESGTLLSTYTLTGVQNALEHIFADTDDPDYFWAWWQTATQNRFWRIRVSDGAVVEDVPARYKFVEGVSEEGATASPTQFSGADYSCVPLLLRGNSPTIPVIPPFDCGNATDPVTVTISGTDFGSDPTVTAVDPNGNTIPFTITSHTTTQIVGTLIVATCGVWSITVCNGSLCTSVSVDTGTDYLMRRERRFLLPFDQNFRIFISRLEIIAQTGVGRSTGQGADPVLMLRMSWDGGFTWGHERQLSIGKMGEYVRRCYTTRLGSGRMPVCEIACSDPVFLSLLDCTVDAEKGTS